MSQFTDDLVERTAEADNLIAVVNKGYDTFMEVGEALSQLKQKRLYIIYEPTWAKFLESQWPGRFNRNKADRLIDCFHVSHNLEVAGEKVEKIPVRSAQKLNRLAYRSQLAAWDAAKDKCKADAEAKGLPTENLTPTSSHVERAVREVESREAEPIDLIRMAARDFNELRKQTTALEQRIEALAQNAWGAELKPRLDEIRASMKAVRETLKQAAPYCLCYCARGCRMCRRRKPRWISRAIYRSAPKEMQEKVTEHA